MVISNLLYVNSVNITSNLVIHIVTTAVKDMLSFGMAVGFPA